MNYKGFLEESDNNWSETIWICGENIEERRKWIIKYLKNKDYKESEICFKGPSIKDKKSFRIKFTEEDKKLVDKKKKKILLIESKKKEIRNNVKSLIENYEISDRFQIKRLFELIIFSFDVEPTYFYNSENAVVIIRALYRGNKKSKVVRMNLKENKFIDLTYNLPDVLIKHWKEGRDILSFKINKEIFTI